MELYQIKQLLSEPDKLISKVQAQRSDLDDAIVKSADIDVSTHAVMDDTKRKKREVVYDTGEVDDKGEPKTRTDYEEVYRIPTAVEKHIVDWTVQMAASEPIEPKAAPSGPIEESMFRALELTLRDNKMQFIFQEFLRMRATYTCAALIWYLEEAEPGFWKKVDLAAKQKLSVLLISPETGDKLYPIRNGLRKMIGMGREYKVLDDEGKEVQKFQIYTNDLIYTFTHSGAGWESDQAKTPFGKGNFIYDDQNDVEWAAVTSKRARLEDVDSDHADQNLATGSPILVASKLIGVGKRGQTGKTFEVEDGGKLDMLEAAGAPESLKMERDNLRKGIAFDTSTPDQSIFDAEKMGANTPGVTIRMMMLPAEIKARKNQQGSFGMAVQRCYNLLQAGLAFLHSSLVPAKGMEITPGFKIFMPTNKTEDYANIVSLFGAGLISRETAVRMLAFTDDPDAELAKIEADLKAATGRVPAPVKPSTEQ